MSVSSHDGSLGRSGLIIPENIPGDDLQPFRLEAVAGRVRQAGSQALTHAETAQTTWSGLPGVLESPQGAVMYAALGTPSSLAATIEHKFDRVAYALEEFAAAVRPIKNEFARIKEDAVAFRATIRWDERVWVSPAETHEYQFDAQASVTATRGYVRTADQVVEYLQGRGESTLVTGGRVKILAHWTQSSEHIDANNALMDRLADAYARLQNVEADCADAINRQRELCMAEVQKIEAWQLKQSGENTVALPWGSRVDEDRNCGESFWWGVGNAGKEAGVGFLGLFGYNGVRNDWTPEQAGQSWLGAVQGIGALLVLTCPPLTLLGKAGVPVLSDATDMGDAMLKGLIAYDAWAENPAEAAGRVLVNVGSLFIPGAGEVSAAIKALTAGSRIVDAAGDAARLGEAALSGLNKVDNLAGMLDNVGTTVGTGAKVDDLVSVGTKIDMPDSDLLHVGARAPDSATSPSSLLDGSDGGPGARAGDAETPAPRAPGTDSDVPASPVPHADTTPGDGAPLGAGDDGATSGSGSAGPDAPADTPAPPPAAGPGTEIAVREFMEPDELYRVINDGYGAAVFGDDLLGHYIKSQPTLGLPGSGRSFFLMPAEDILRITDSASAARQTGMSPSTMAAYAAGKDVYAILFPTDGMPLARPSAVDAGLNSPSGVWPHFLDEPNPTGPWGHTAVRGDDFYLRNPTRELVTPHGWQIGAGSVLVRFDSTGLQILRRYP